MEKPSKKLSEILISALLCIVLFFLIDHLPIFKSWNDHIYSHLLNVEYALRKPPCAIKDMVIVAIDNETVLHMPSRWPYPRSNFATVIDNIKQSSPRAIGIDFAYLGQSTPEDDATLKKALDDPRLTLAATINEYGYLDTSYASSLQAKASYGVVTKLQDDDGIIRKNLLYLVSTDKTSIAFLSWEMQILKSIKGLNTNSLEDHGDKIHFNNPSGEQWSIPVDPAAKSFLIHFRAHTKDFQLLSFYKVFNNDFDPSLLKDKIVFIGVLPALLGDSHNTAFGWVPGVVLNANAFLALYTHDFLQKFPWWPQRLFILLCVVWTTLLILPLKNIPAMTLIALETCLFLVLSYLFLIRGYVLDYGSLFSLPIVVPLISKKIIKNILFNKLQ